MAAVSATLPSDTLPSIRSALLGLPDALSPFLPTEDFASIFENWSALCILFETAKPHIRPIHERILVWEPEDAVDKKIRALWIKIYEAFKHPELDCRVHAVASFTILAELLSKQTAASSDESDSKQNGDTEPPAASASPVEDFHPSAEDVIFGDRDYAKIRRNFRPLLDQIMAFPDIVEAMENWPLLCALYQKLDLTLLYDQITAWNPEQRQTQRVKALLDLIFTAFQHPGIDGREDVITAFTELALRILEDAIIEERPRALSPNPAGSTAPPSSPVEPANQTDTD